jgi:hypothetical protein
MPGWSRALVGDEMTVNLHPQLDHAGHTAAVDDHVVERGGLEHAAAIAPDRGRHQCARVFLELAAQDGTHLFAVAVERDVGDEAQAPLVDAHQRHTAARQLAADAQHGAVAADHQRQVAGLADGGHIQSRVLQQAGVGRGFLFQRDVATFTVQEVGDFLDRVARAGRMVFAHDGDMRETQGPVPSGRRGPGVGWQAHAEITTQLLCGGLTQNPCRPAVCTPVLP